MCVVVSLTAAVSSRGSWEESSSSSQPSLTALTSTSTRTPTAWPTSKVLAQTSFCFSLSLLHYCTLFHQLHHFLFLHHHTKKGDDFFFFFCSFDCKVIIMQLNELVYECIQICLMMPYLKICKGGRWSSMYVYVWNVCWCVMSGYERVLSIQSL